MNWIELFVAFGGGVFGALMGGTFGFIFTGILTLVGTAIVLSTGDSHFLNTVAFGPMFSPAVVFVGGVAATALSGYYKKQYEQNEDQRADIYTHGTMIGTSQYPTGDPRIILIGGLFGMLGYAINYLLQQSGLGIDTVALTVVIGNVLARFFIGRGGLFGNYPKDEKIFNTQPRFLLFNGLWSFGISIITAYLVIQTGVANLGWAISAVTLLFLISDIFNIPVTHHITMVVGYFAIATNNILLCGLIGSLAWLLGEYVDAATNRHVPTYIDMPGIIIALGSLIAFLL